MDPSKLRNLLQAVAAGDASIDGALEELSQLPFQDVGTEARIDHHRHLRSGVPEVVLGQWKTAEQISQILKAMSERGGAALATRVDASKARAIMPTLDRGVYHETARLIAIPALESTAGKRAQIPIAVVAAGTSDVPVAEEAALTLEFLHAPVERIYDVGVAGVHRLLAEAGKLRSVAVTIVVAGMEGALPSVVAGLVACPVIAVPTSVGYGASIGGFAALFGMLSSCSPGVTVVNIDNGFGAAVAAVRMTRSQAGDDAGE